MRLFVLGISFAALASAANTPTQATFHKEVLPVLQKNCQACHRPGEAAPMSLLTYQEARPWAKAIRQAVISKKMPPWFADPHVGKFSNDRSLSQAEIDTLVSWSDGGAPEGNPKDAPKPLSFIEGWNIGQPDMVVEMPKEYHVAAGGTIEYTYFVIPMNLTEDRWVQMAEVRPGNRAVVHHVIAFTRAPGSKWLKDAKFGEPFVPQKGDRNSGSAESSGEWLVGYAPGFRPDVMKPGQARLLKAGSELVLQMHYTANGKPATDRTKVGLVFAKEPPKERVMMVAAANKKFVIPPGAGNHRVDSSITLHADSTLISLLPHMHLRGKAFEYRVTYPTGESEMLLSVPKYDFNWQLSYYPAATKMLPKGTRIDCTAWFDNSPNNPANPDPASEVRYGDQSWEEMMIGFFDVAIDTKLNPVNLMRPSSDKPAPSGPAE